MKYEITIESDFSAAHRLREYKGKCETIHGHNWKVQAVFAAGKLNKTGIVMDFAAAKKYLNQIMDELDHKDLNKHEFFIKNNPTSELIAKFIFNRLKTLIKNKVNLIKVSVWETPTSCATYSIN